MSSDAHPGWCSALGQVRSCAGVLALGLVQGMAIGWSSPALAKLAQGQGPFTPTLSETTWIVSLFDLGCSLGVVAGAAVFSHAGRRWTLLVGPATFSAWSLLTYFATAPGYLMAARALSGAGQGMCMSFSYIYVGEVATPRLRGALILTVSLLLPVGQLAAYVVGPAVSYWTQALAPLPVAVLSGLLMLTVMEETPFYLAMRGRHDEVVSALARLRGRPAVDPGEAVVREAQAVMTTVQRQQRAAASWREMFRAGGAKRAALIVLVESGALALVGVTTVLAFTQQIFELAGTPVRPDVSAAVLIAIKVAMVLVSMVLIERLGRRLQLGLGAFVNSLAMLGLSSFFLARDTLGADVARIQWLPLVCLIIFIAATGVGVNAVPQVLMSELLPQRAKAIVAPVAVVIVSLTSFGLNKAFMLVGTNYGFHLPFGLYAVTNLMVSIFTFLMVPETKGKSLADIQGMLAGRYDTKNPDKIKAKNSLELTYVFPHANKPVVDESV
ncbi:Facilitated trehalose transporter Tret1 [Frankliniella fusca]|uniref:Facilitated trehalose transporter Tret1 n=1 Tax=Frankliniella fusca TaxID=407009 RepID=A0AAE1LI61_9NEOP|nr:Facilitated trehalose transporter Tret1 [Frankliniella fusca]